MEILKKWEKYESYEKNWDIIIGLTVHSPVICDTSLIII